MMPQESQVLFDYVRWTGGGICHEISEAQLGKELTNLYSCVLWRSGYCLWRGWDNAKDFSSANFKIFATLSWVTSIGDSTLTLAINAISLQPILFLLHGFL